MLKVWCTLPKHTRGWARAGMRAGVCQRMPGQAPHYLVLHASDSPRHRFIAVCGAARPAPPAAALPEGSDPPVDDYDLGPGWRPNIKQFFAIYTGCLFFSCFTNSLK